MKPSHSIFLAFLVLALTACGGGGGGGGDGSDNPLSPGQPLNVGAVYSPPGQAGNIRVSWEVGTGPAPTAYVVYRKTIPENVWISIADVDDTVFEAIDEGPFGFGPAYVYRVVAVNDAGSSVPGDTTAFTPRPLTQGAIYIWGRNDTGQAGVGDTIDDFWPRSPAIANVVKVDAGDGFTLALGTLNVGTQLLAFGDDTRGQLGDGPPLADSDVPVLVTDPNSGFGTVHFVTAMAAGGRHALAITDNGLGTRKIWAWGANNFGQVGDGTNIDRPSPVDLTSQFASQAPVNFIGVAAGEDFSLALTDDGRLFSWGSNSWGQLGLGLTASPPTVGGSSASPRRIIFPGGLVGRIENLTAGGEHALVMEKVGTGINRIWSFGDDREGQLGDAGGTLLFKDRPVLVDNSTGLGDAGSFAAGDAHSLALDRNGNVWTWGAGYLKPAGTSTKNPLPMRMAAPSSIVRISAGGKHSLAYRSDGSLFGWGDNQRGQLNHDPTEALPGDVLETPYFLPGWASLNARIATGGEHSIAFVP